MSETFFAQHSNINMGSDGVGQVSYGDDSRLSVRFFRGKEIHGLQTQEAGRPIYVGVDMVGIRQPGERDEPHFVVTELHKQRFPRQWEAYQNKQEYIPDGTPLAVIFGAEPETVENMKGLKIYTVEQLAGLQEAAISRLGMGGRNLVVKAQKFMEAATGYKAATKMGREMEDLKSENDMLKTRLEALEKALSATDQPARRGRPPNVQPETQE